ncbi:hypothetical protein [Nonomuraea sp. bgisy101]|uniref:hypothetical protein n=1 Tax=Nonomuraea sp. bgisy101 TaxID=3413784 RepID=UPI003D7570C3
MNTATHQHPYPATDAAPLTETAAERMRSLLALAEQQRREVGEQREDFDRQLAIAAGDWERERTRLMAEIDAQDTLGAELDATITRYRNRLGALDERARATHEQVWSGAQNSIPQTGMWQAPELSKDPDASLDRLITAHAAQKAQEGPDPLDEP